MRKKMTFLSAVLFAIVALTTMTALRSQGQNSSSQKEVATPVREGVMPEKQREHSKLYRDYKGTGNLSDLVNQPASSDEVTISILPGTPELAPGGQSQPAGSQLNELAANADAVVVGTVKDKTSQPTDNGRFVFTDYNLQVEEVLKDNGAAHIEPQSLLIVTRPGGKILLNGRIVNAVDRSFKHFDVGGRYLLFLKYIPTTGAYQAVNSTGSFDLKNNKVATLTEAPEVESRSERDAASFIGDVRIAINASGHGKRGGNDE